jgi:5-methylcytosine-specific restriction endonuclease McrA
VEDVEDGHYPTYLSWRGLRRSPFTIILNDTWNDTRPLPGAAAPGAARALPSAAGPLRIKIDPGSKTTGLALVDDLAGQVLWAAELTHRGEQVKERLARRRAGRRSRRARHTRYRPARFLKRRRRAGWVSPSLASRVQHVVTWVEQLRRRCPINASGLELVKFATQLLHNPEISGIEYQQGTLAGYEVRESLLEKWGHQCAHCKHANVPLQIEHMRPRSRQGSDALWNLTLSCEACNLRKGTQTAAEFGFPELEAAGKRPLRDAAAVNTTRWALYRRLQELGVPIEVGTGGRTKWTRTVRGLPKTHWIDAACVGASTPQTLQVIGVRPLLVKATDRHSRQMCRTNALGLPDPAPEATSVVAGFRTGDLVRAAVPASSVKAGTYVGRMAARATGSCNITTAAGTIQGIHVRYCRPLQRGDGFTYQHGPTALPPPA